MRLDISEIKCYAQDMGLVDTLLKIDIHFSYIRAHKDYVNHEDKNKAAAMASILQDVTALKIAIERTTTPRKLKFTLESIKGQLTEYTALKKLFSNMLNDSSHTIH